ncbi:MAG: T9SS type A sorting domain-containing protein [Bacteroidetes bacterium]|nr:T9SS type A sorting domain-containing protein [Bacteroidota bacterium]
MLQLEILDLSGRKINSVEIENFTRNANQAGFVLTNHGTAPGIYFYRLIAENRVLQSGKIVIAPK